jgi:uncharacterized protein
MDREKAIHIVKTTKDWSELRKALEVLIPELRESEDERIRKEIISALKFANDSGVYDKHIAWLEKQKECHSDDVLNRTYQEGFEDGFRTGRETERRNSSDNDFIKPRMQEPWNNEKQKEQKPAQYVYVKFRTGDIVQKITGDKDIVTIADVDTDAEEYRLTNSGFIPFKYQHLWSMVEQKPAEWSEEDRMHLAWIIECFDSWKYQVPEFADHYQSAIDWLKSLRPQPHWKPSEEQLEILGRFNDPVLKSLYQDLKKL